MRRVILLLLMLIWLPLISLAETDYIIEDSNTRQLTVAELWRWDYESLRFIRNEIYARHGYQFVAGSDTAAYFEAKSWYTPHPKGNIDGCMRELSETEIANVERIQQVMSEMERSGTLNTERGASFWSDEPVLPSLDFKLTSFSRGQEFPVYSAPSTKSWRGANGHSAVSTNGEVWCAGKIDNWLLIYYETNNGSIRVGYIDANNARGSFEQVGELPLNAIPAKITASSTITDDPARAGSAITTLAEGTQVIYLAPYYTPEQDWAYIETKANGKTVRGFVQADAVKRTE